MSQPRKYLVSISSMNYFEEHKAVGAAKTEFLIEKERLTPDMQKIVENLDAMIAQSPVESRPMTDEEIAAWRAARDEAMANAAQADQAEPDAA